MQIQGVNIVADAALSSQEIEQLAVSEIQEWAEMGKDLASIQMSLEGEEVLIQAIEKSPIRRVRRITGYLSNIENFNDAKRAECHDRYVHAG